MSILDTFDRDEFDPNAASEDAFLTRADRGEPEPSVGSRVRFRHPQTGAERLGIVLRFHSDHPNLAYVRRDDGREAVWHTANIVALTVECRCGCGRLLPAPKDGRPLPDVSGLPF